MMLLPLKETKISQHFGKNPDVYKNWGLEGHNGIDLFTFWGDRVYAAEGGIVVQVKNDPYGLGKNITIRGKYLCIYAHLSSIGVQPGDEVKQGQLIGLEGNTGSVKTLWDGIKEPNFDKPFYIGTHLHFGVYEVAGCDVEGYQINYPVTDICITILNYDNGYHGAIDPFPLFMLEVIGDNKTKRQYVKGFDGKLRHIHNEKMLDDLHLAGIISKDMVEWKDDFTNLEVIETWALLK